MGRILPLTTALPGKKFFQDGLLLTNSRTTKAQKDGGYDVLQPVPWTVIPGLYPAFSKAITKSKHSKVIAKEIIEQQKAANRFAKESLDVAVRGLDKRDVAQLQIDKKGLKDTRDEIDKQFSRLNGYLKYKELMRKQRAPSQGTAAQYFKKAQPPWNKIPGFKGKNIKSKNDPQYKALVAAYNRQHPNAPWAYAGMERKRAPPQKK